MVKINVYVLVLYCLTSLLALYCILRFAGCPKPGVIAIVILALSLAADAAHTIIQARLVMRKSLSQRYGEG